MRIPILPREKAAILYLRGHFDYSISILHEFFGRSASAIHRMFKFNYSISALAYRDMRKIPNRIRRLARDRQWKTLEFYWQKWLSWISLTEGKPP